MVKNAKNCWKSSLFCPFLLLDKEEAVKIRADISTKHDFLVSYHFDLKSKEIQTHLPYIELAFSKFLEEVTYTEL